MRNEQIKFQMEVESSIIIVRHANFSGTATILLEGSVNHLGSVSESLISAQYGFDDLGKGFGGRDMAGGSCGRRFWTQLGEMAVRYRKLDVPVFEG